MNDRQTGNQRESAASDCKQDGIRDAYLPGHDRKQRDRNETKQN